MSTEFGGGGLRRWAPPHWLLGLLLLVVTPCKIMSFPFIMSSSPSSVSPFFIAHPAHFTPHRSYEVMMTAITHALGRAKPGATAVSSTYMSITYTLFCLLKRVCTPDA